MEMKDALSFKYPDFYMGYNVRQTTEPVIDNSHCHDRYELLYVLSGAGRFVVEGAEYTVKPRTIMLVRPFEYHCMHLDGDTVYARYCVHFPSAFLGSEGARILEKITAGESGENYYLSSVSDSLDSIFERFEIAEMLPAEEQRIYLRSLLFEIIILLSATAGEHLPQDEAELGARVIRYLNNNIDKDLSLDKLARRFFVSKFYLCRAFKKHNGISVHGYINQKRVMFAKQLIEEGETASGAAYKVGFGDYSAFYRAYVKILGTSPTSVQTRKEIL